MTRHNINYAWLKREMEMCSQSEMILAKVLANVLSLTALNSDCFPTHT